MTCCELVQSRSCKKSGLQSIKREHRSKINCQNTQLIEYSIDIDKCCKSLEPNAPRWDYAVFYHGQCLFVEVHDASSPKMIEEIKKKFEWIKNKISECNGLIQSSSFYWIATKNISKLSKNSKYYKQLNRLESEGLRGPMKILRCE